MLAPMAEPGCSCTAPGPVPMKLPEVPFFESVSPQGLARLAGVLRRHEFAAGRTILSAGDPPAEMHLVVEGAVRIEISRAQSASAPVTLLGPGQIFGEMAVVSGNPVSASVVAHRDTVTLSLPAGELEALLAREPGLSRYISSVVIDRLRRQTRAGSSPPGPEMALIVVDEPSLPLLACASSILCGVRHYAPAATVLDALHDGEIRPTALPGRIGQWRADATRSQHLVCVAGLDAARRIAGELGPGDAVLFLTGSPRHAARPPLPDHAADQQVVLLDARLSAAAGCRWVCHLMTSEVEATQRAAGHWDRARTPALDRLARWITRREVGIALSVGAAAGYVQLGLLAVLEETGIPFDFICGTSVGGIAAAYCAQTASVAEAAEEMIRYGSELAARRRMQWIPRSGLVSETWLDDLAASAFRGRTFADLRYPVAVVAADLIANERVVFETGMLARAIRATSAIPGIFPPVRMGARILVDGGLVSRVPTDLLVQRRCGLAIASLVHPDQETESAQLAREAEVLDKALQAPFGIRAALGASWRMLGWWDSAAQARRADIVIDMPVPRRDSYNFRGAQRLVALGRRIAEARAGVIHESFERMLRPDTL